MIEWGDGIYGAEAAAQTYFGVPAAAVGPSQAALLAGAIINPRLLNTAEPTPRLPRRQQLILRRMGGVTPPEQGAGPAQAARARRPIVRGAARPGFDVHDSASAGRNRRACGSKTQKNRAKMGGSA